MITGILNIGNTCFMNACIQVLNKTTNIKFLTDAVTKVGTIDSMVVASWNLLILALEGGKIVDPNPFVRVVHMCAREKGTREFTGFGQNDVSEFLMFIVECFHNSLSGPSRMIATRPTSEVSSTVWDMMQTISHEYSEINDIFYGVSVTEVLAPNTDRTRHSVKAEQYFILDLPIPNTNKYPSLYDCFDAKTTSELLTGENKWYNEKTKRKERVRIRTLYFRFPEVLVITLGRFTYGTLRKNEVLVECPLTRLDLQPYCHSDAEKPSFYNLYGVCNHIGGSNGGHYNAYVKDNTNGKWYMCEDDMIVELDEKDVITHSTYCLFYGCSKSHNVHTFQ